MAISITDIGGANAASGTGSVSIAIPAGGVPAGALIFVGTEESGTTFSTGGTVSDTVNTYVNISHLSHANIASLGYGMTWYVQGCKALTSSNSIKYTDQSGSTAECCVAAFYATGIATVGALDTAVTATNAASAASATVTSGTPAVTGELFVAFLSMDATQITVTQDTGHGWAHPPDGVNPHSVGQTDGGTQVLTGIGTRIYNPTFSSSGVNYAAFIHGFKPGTPAGATQRIFRTRWQQPWAWAWALMAATAALAALANYV